VIALGNFDDTVKEAFFFSIVSSHGSYSYSDQLDTLAVHLVLGTDWYLDTSNHIERVSRNGKTVDSRTKTCAHHHLTVECFGGSRSSGVPADIFHKQNRL